MQVMPIIYPATKQERLEVMEHLGGKGPKTPAVERMTMVFGRTLGIAMITRATLGRDDVRRN